MHVHNTALHSSTGDELIEISDHDDEAIVSFTAPAACAAGGDEGNGDDGDVGGRTLPAPIPTHGGGSGGGGGTGSEGLDVQMPYLSLRYGPVDGAFLAEAISHLSKQRREAELVTRGPGVDKDYKYWNFEYATKRRSTCKGCNGAILRKGPRLHWNNGKMEHIDNRKMPGYNQGNWHLACGILMGKITSTRNCLLPVPQLRLRNIDAMEHDDRIEHMRMCRMSFFQLRTYLRL